MCVRARVVGRWGKGAGLRPLPRGAAKARPRRESSRPACAQATPRTCRGPARAERRQEGGAHRWRRRLGGRGPEGDVTGPGPGGRNRAAAAAVAQRRAAAGSESWSRDSLRRARNPPTGGETERRTRGRVAAIAAAAGVPSGSPESGHLVFTSAPPPRYAAQLPSGRGEGAQPPPPAGPAAPCWGPSARGRASPCRARCGRCLSSPPAPGEPSLPAPPAAGAGPRDSASAGRAAGARTRGKGAGAAARAPGLQRGPGRAGGCAERGAEPLGSSLQPAPAPRQPPAGTALRRPTQSALGEPGERRTIALNPVPLVPSCGAGRALSPAPPSSLQGNLRLLAAASRARGAAPGSRAPGPRRPALSTWTWLAEGAGGRGEHDPATQTASKTPSNPSNRSLGQATRVRSWGVTGEWCIGGSEEGWWWRAQAEGRSPSELALWVTSEPLNTRK